jgi:hypothetical protein
MDVEWASSAFGEVGRADSTTTHAAAVVYYANRLQALASGRC